MPVPGLTRQTSSVAALIEQERSLSGESRSSEKTQDKSEEEQTQPRQPTSAAPENQGGDTDVEGGDTDIEGGDTDTEDAPPVSLEQALSREKTVVLKEDQIQEASSKPPLRMSSRLMSMKRRGKIVLLKELTNEFEFNAGDILTVRGEEDDFYVCRVLEDVPVMANNFLVAWYNRVGPNLYEVGQDV